ncbi:hypothetical protein, partial [Actinomadura darangshiensis]|uniref:hypothetical protein n=1 Tax=Actinomadura darangshiensis TaxID=705336 RepID=UPI001A9D9101
HHTTGLDHHDQPPTTLPTSRLTGGVRRVPPAHHHGDGPCDRWCAVVPAACIVCRLHRRPLLPGSQ